MSSNRPIIEAKGLVKAYGLLPVLRKFNIEIARGDFVALLGPNGSGKSTFLKLCAGLTKATAGNLYIGGWELPQEAEAVRGQIGMVSHKSLLYENLTARENLVFFARLYNLTPQQIEDTITNLLERVGLKRRSNDLVRTYSRGMQQRLSIARALLHNPQVLLFDEPYTGLDQDAAGVLDNLLLEAHEDGRTILMATHQLERAARLANRIIILSRGEVGFDSEGKELTALELASHYTEVTGAASVR